MMNGTPGQLTCAEAADDAGLYVLGALTPADAARVRGHLDSCPEPHGEFAELGGVAAALLEGAEPVTPPAALRERVRERIALEAAVAPVAPSMARPVVLTGGRSVRSPESVRPAAREQGWLPAVQRWVMPLAAVLLIGVLAGWNVLLQQDAQRSSERVAALGEAIALSRSPDARVAGMSGVGPGAESARGLAAVAPDGRGVLVISGLPPAPSGHSYQAWYIVGETPHAAGLIHVGQDRLGVVTGLELPEGTTQMALTVEPVSGSDAPTTEPVVAGSFGGESGRGGKPNEAPSG